MTRTPRTAALVLGLAVVVGAVLLAAQPSSPSAPQASLVVRGPTEPEVSELATDQLVRMTIELDLTTAAPGDRVQAEITITNTGDRTVQLTEQTSCGDAFGEVTGGGLLWGSAGDSCSSAANPASLPPGGSRTEWSYAFVEEGTAASAVDVVATALVRLEVRPGAQPALGPDTRLTALARLQLQDARTGTRTFRLVNDSPRPVFLQCPCTPLTPQTRIVEAGRSELVTASVHGRFQVSRDNSLQASAVSCLDVSSVPSGSTNTVLTVSGSVPCAPPPR